MEGGIKRKVQYQQTMDTIRGTVDELVEKIGFNEMRIRDICEKANVSIGTFYHYFPSKNALLIDRYRRANKKFNELYENELKEMHSVDALKRFIQEIISYSGSRILGILIPYSKALLDEYGNWSEIEKRAYYTVSGELVDKGIASGEISNKYSPEEIKYFLWNFINGLNTSQCLTKGTFLKDGYIGKPIMDWIESLRN